MGKIEAMEELKLRNLSWDAPKYHDYPDGEDLLGKLSFTTKVSGVLGALMGASYTVGVDPIPPTLVGKLAKTFHVIIPTVGVAALFTTVTYYSTRFRKKDDEYNYMLGGLAAGALLGIVTPSPNLGVVGAVSFAALAGTYKHHKLLGLELLPEFRKKHYPSYYIRNLDTTMTAERKGNWTRDPPPK